MAKKAKKKDRKEKREKRQGRSLDVRIPKKNTWFFGIGLVFIAVGFVLLRAGDIVLAPLLLVIGYLVFFPLGILLK
jgi:hypothetical protein